LLNPLLVENLTDPPFLLVKAPIIENKASESTLDQSQWIETAVNPTLTSEDLPPDDIVTKENENVTVQILFVNIDSDEHGGNLPIPLP